MSEEQPPRRSQRLGEETRRVSRQAGQALGQLNPISRARYPHDTHPALVPGIGIDEQRRRYSIDWFIFAITGVLTVAFVIWGVTNPASVGEVAGIAYDWTMVHAGWLFNALAIVVLVFLLILAATRYGRIPLGKDGEQPEYSTFAWIAMLFAAGIGIGVLFWGPAEPLAYFYNVPAPLEHEPESNQALHSAMAQTYFHWGLHAWGIYALVGGAVAYAAYRRGRVPLMSAIFEKMFGKKHSEGFAGKMIDMFAIIATLFGTAAALGIAVMQIGEGVVIVAGASELTNTMMIGIIAVLSACFVVSAVSGISRGIRYLSSINIVLTIGVIAVFFFAGPTLFLLNLLPSAFMEYLGTMFQMMGRSASWGQETLDFQSAWTVYYWAWWISWSPFVGIFIARVSRGRTIRQFILGVILVPSSLLFVAYGVMGGVSMWLAREGQGNVSPDLSAPEVLFSVIDALPYLQWLPIVVVVILAIFFITSADSASVVMGILTTRGDQDPNKLVVVFWGLVMAGVATVMLLLGEGTALQGLQSLVIVTALPFALVLILIMIAWSRELATDPHALREKYADLAVSNAVLDGVERYGDDFALEVVPTHPGEGAGAEVDSEHDDYTEWYQRTDEDGAPVGYDFATGEWADGWDPETGEIGTVVTEDPKAEQDPEGQTTKR
ncbi:BCCT family transporter [Nesterenkonia halotolerans]|uniref:Choline/carnitine/betaine transport n=1 Tax=Nesterenkonia halotolerans TaxID=225325 RepID=A0ABR9J6L7_9MICC|nr:BCCT family transporter [Nesterenkonia halotolerans]MBE1514643.1 choline/carnitine/betaine transport [Nesterenkonia halotolerans]